MDNLKNDDSYDPLWTPPYKKEYEEKKLFGSYMSPSRISKVKREMKNEKIQPQKIGRKKGQKKRRRVK